ncbi:MAG: biosynthesis protein WbpP [Candidatus Acidoferrum typicum]|nr:biosynthesis protein WbpP [Candidatus Acidoferrum typicum]
MRYLVTGGAGFIGSNTVDELVRRGHDVVVLDDLSSGKAENLIEVQDKVELLRHSVTDLDRLREACRGVDYVLHLGARTSVPRSVKDPLETNRVNVDGTLNVLIAARDAKVKRVVFAGSSSVYGETPTLPKREEMPAAPISPYGLSKLAGEMYGQVFQRCYGLEFVSLRYFNVFGPRQDPGSPYSGVLSLFNAALLNDTQPIVYGDGEQSRDFTYVGNAVEANLLACESKRAAGLAINIGTGSRYTLNQTLALLEKITGRPAKAKYGPPREGDIHDSQADISRAKDVLGYNPRFGFEEGLKDTWEWFCAVEKPSSRS